MGLGLESSIRKNLIKIFFFQKYDKFFQSVFFNFQVWGWKAFQVALVYTTKVSLLNRINKVKQQNEENHVPAIELLKDRYSNSQVLISPYMKKFVLLPKVKNEDDIKGL